MLLNDVSGRIGPSGLATPVLAAPDPARAVVVVPAPGTGPGAWAGSPSAVSADGEVYLACRMRTLDQRGYAVQLARSADGVRFQPVASLTKEQFGAESLERPALVRTADGTWRLYLSCATPGTKHWRIELLEADAPDRFDPARSRVVLPGDAMTAVKDPVIAERDGTWYLWASVHPLADPDQTDRMTTQLATSPDGISWTWQGTALAPRPGEWDARGVRVAAVRWDAGGLTAYYDGRATAGQNCEELTGIATGDSPAGLVPVGTAPVAQSPAGGLGLRYLTIVELAGGGERWYYELTNASGAHDLVSELRAG